MACIKTGGVAACQGERANIIQKWKLLIKPRPFFFWTQMFLRRYIFWVVKKCLSPTNCGSEIILGQKKIMGQQKLWLKKLGQQKLWVNKNCG